LGDSPAPIDEKNEALTRPRQDHPGYAAMMENLDSNVGRLLDAITAKGIEGNTIVVFTSDNGGLSTKPKRPAFTCQSPLRAGKGWCYEGGIRVPMIIRWPRKIVPTETDTVGITMDIYPTLLDLAGLSLKPKQHLDGLSLPLKSNTTFKANTMPRLTGWHYPKRHGSGHRPSTAIRYGNKKLIHFIENNTYELYDLSQDISESNNLVPSCDQQELHSLKTKLHAWVETTNRK
jgi:arylsulfatase A-like enzyme